MKGLVSVTPPEMEVQMEKGKTGTYCGVYL
jgi:hypothetical protein